MTLYELRIELTDHPGALSAVTRSLARLRMNIVEVAIHEVDGSRAVDEIIVSAREEHTAPEVEQALRGAGADLLSWRVCPVRLDPVVAATTWLPEALRRPDDLGSFRRGLEAITGLVGLELVAANVAQGCEAGHAALRQGRPLVRRVETMPDFLNAGGAGARWLLAAPDRRNGDFVAFASRPFAIRFTATELRRLSAVLDCRRELVNLQAAAPIARATWSVAMAANA